MLSCAALLVLACSYLLAVPVNDEIGNASETKSAKVSIAPLPYELISQIADFGDEKTSFMFGSTNKVLNKLTEKRNNKNRLLRIGEYCGVRHYFHLTSNGYHILSESIYDPLTETLDNQNSTEFLKGMTQCIQALRSNIRHITDKLTNIHIYLPNINLELLPELVATIDSYFIALDDLFKAKRNFQKVSVFGIQQNIEVCNTEFLHEEYEKRVLL